MMMEKLRLDSILSDFVSCNILDLRTKYHYNLKRDITIMITPLEPNSMQRYLFQHSTHNIAELAASRKEKRNI